MLRAGLDGPAIDIQRCALCGTRVELAPDAKARAEATFRPEELKRTGVVCDDCLRAWRADDAHLDARYREQEL